MLSAHPWGSRGGRSQSLPSGAIPQATGLDEEEAEGSARWPPVDS